MDLWIYSQDKKYLQEIKGVKNNKSSIWGYSYTDTGILLGTYESEERALEILQEIKRHIAFLNVEMGAGRFGELDFESDVVFEMPKE